MTRAAAPWASRSRFLNMQTVLIIIHLIIVLGLIGVVLLQRSEGGLGLGGGGGGGGGGFMTGRGQANALTRATAILAALFFVTSLALAWISSHGSALRSIRRRRRLRNRADLNRGPGDRPFSFAGDGEPIGVVPL